MKNLNLSNKPLLSRLAEVLGWLNDWVTGGNFVAGNDVMSIADLACVATYSTLKAVGRRRDA